MIILERAYPFATLLVVGRFARGVGAEVLLSRSSKIGKFLLGARRRATAEMQLREPDDVGLMLRIGLHQGEVVVEGLDAGWRTSDVNLSACHRQPLVSDGRTSSAPVWSSAPSSPYPNQ
jgi:hypothetical protein